MIVNKQFKLSKDLGHGFITIDVNMTTNEHDNDKSLQQKIAKYNMEMMNSLFTQFIDKSEHFINKIKSKNKDL